MARVPETGFYFEPIAGRLALLPEGAAFPSGEEWAYVGDGKMAADAARLEVAARWPGTEPGELEVEDLRGGSLSGPRP